MRLIEEYSSEEIYDKVDQMLWDLFQVDIDEIPDSKPLVKTMTDSIEKLIDMYNSEFRVGDVVRMYGIYSGVSYHSYEEKLEKIEDGMYYFKDLEFRGLVNANEDLKEDNLLSGRGLNSWNEIDNDDTIKTNEDFVNWCKEHLGFSGEDALRYKYFYEDSLIGVWPDELEYYDTEKVN